MRVDGPGASDPVNKTKKKQGAKSAGGDFDALLSAADETEPPSAAANVSATPGVNALLSLQDTGNLSEADAVAYKHGEDILEELNNLRMGLLSGLIPPEKLQNLANLVKQSQSEASDPNLKDALKDIEVRALVELEKYNKAKGKQAG